MLNLIQHPLFITKGYGSAFGLKQTGFLFHAKSITAQGAVGSNDAVAGNLWSEGIPMEGLTDRPGTSATYATGQFPVGNGFAFSYIEQLQIDFPLEIGDDGRGLNFGTNILHGDGSLSV